MVKQKTKKTIGWILVLGGLIYLLYIGATFLMSHLLGLVLAIAAILFGSWWGLKR